MGKANRDQFETITNKEKKIRAIIRTLEDIDTIVDQLQLRWARIQKA